MRPARIVTLVIGCLVMIPAIALLLGGGALGLGYAFARDDDGYFDATLDRLETDTAAITADDITFTTEPGSPSWVIDALDVDVRIRATSADSAREVFIGIARERDVDAYLAGAAHADVVDVTDDLEPVLRTRLGDRPLDPPTEQDFWAVSARGSGTQELEWEATGGRWAIVLMNADAAPGLSADVNVGVTAGFLLPLAIVMMGLGVVGLIIGVVLIVVGAHGAARRPETERTPSPGGVPSPRPAPERSPVVLTGHLDPELSRWKWLVKWILAIPHVIVLAFLWMAFVVLTFVAAVAIVFTGRYPEPIFEFNVGVLRWTWRVTFYASTGGLGTDRYPPFSLHPDRNEPAHLDVIHPERLSRGLVFVKWFLALPHLLIIALFAGSWAPGLAGDGLVEAIGTVLGGGGLLGVLVLIAGVALLFTGRYPTALFDLIVGFNRWMYRTVAYVALMTDEYPPFRLDQGGTEPSATPLPPPPHPGEGATDHVDVDPASSASRRETTTV